MHTVEEIAALLHIHKEASAHGSTMSNISSAAYTRLKQINGEMTAASFSPVDHTFESEPQLEPVEEPEEGTVPSPTSGVRRNLGGAATGEANPMETNDGE